MVYGLPNFGNSYTIPYYRVILSLEGRGGKNFRAGAPSKPHTPRFSTRSIFGLKGDFWHGIKKGISRYVKTLGYINICCTFAGTKARY
jgi:hypothetical protein